MQLRSCVAVTGSCNSDLTPSLGLSICLGCGPKKTKKSRFLASIRMCHPEFGGGPGLSQFTPDPLLLVSHPLLPFSQASVILSVCSLGPWHSMAPQHGAAWERVIALPLHGAFPAYPPPQPSWPSVCIPAYGNVARCFPTRSGSSSWSLHLPCPLPAAPSQPIVY